jgi:hypothetical protein
LADSADGGTPLQYAFTVLSIDGVVPDSNTQTQNLNIDNILYMSDDTNGNANIVYKDNSNMSPVIYVVSGSSASLAALINGTASDVTGGGNNAFTGNNTHAGTETFAAGIKTGAAGIQATTPLTTTPVGTVTIQEFSTGKDIVTVLTLTNFIVGGSFGAAAKGVGNIVAAYPAGDQHLELVDSFSSIVLTLAGTAVACDTGLGSVIASGAVSVLDGTATFEDRFTGVAITTAPTGGTAVSGLAGATAGIGTGIALNGAAAVKNVFLNAAGTFNANNTGNLTASGVIILKWTQMS